MRGNIRFNNTRGVAERFCQFIKEVRRWHWPPLDWQVDVISSRFPGSGLEKTP
jgi:hypothetical protein